MLVTNSVTGDPRVRREASALAAAGHDVVVVGVQGDEPAEGRLDGFRVRRVVQPSTVRLSVPRPRDLLIMTIDRLRAGSVHALEPRAPAVHALLSASYRAARRGRAPVSLSPAPRPTPSEPALAPVIVPRATSVGDDLHEIQRSLVLNRAFAEVARSERADVYHAHDVDTLLGASLACAGTGAALVYDFHELYTEQFRAGARSRLWVTYHETVERVLAARADLRLTVCDSLGASLARRHGIGPTVTVRNVPALQPAPSQPRRAGPRVVLYHGIFVPDRGLEQLVDAFVHVRGARLVLRGPDNPFRTSLEARARRLGLADRVELVAPVPVTELVASASSADIGVAPFLPACLNTYYCLPNKLFEYLMAGLAVASADLPEIRRVVTSERVGVLFDPSDPRQIAAALQQLVDDEEFLAEARRNALAAARREFNWEVEQKALLDAYAGLMSGRARRSPVR